MAWNSFFTGFKEGFDTSMEDDGYQPFSWIPSVFNGLFEGAESWYKDLTGQTENERINRENLAFQKEQFEYQKALQQMIFDREDTSYSRTADDMRNSGLSLLSMKGTNGTGSVVPTQAPKKELTGINALPLITQMLSELNAFSVGQAQRDNIQAQTKALELENEYNAWNLGYRKNKSVYDDYSSQIGVRKLLRNFDFDKVTGHSDNAFMNSINQARIANGKKPFDSDIWIHRNGIRNNTEENQKIDFDEIVDYSRYALTTDLMERLFSVIK